jgi:bifunctional non-homologous end joining protein LigD
MANKNDQDMIPFTPPMECLSVDRLPDGPGWVYELKLDGFRGLTGDSRKEGDSPVVQKWKGLYPKFPFVAAALEEALPIGTALDGELVAFDKSGRPSFKAIQDANAKSNVVFFVFDVLACRGKCLSEELNQRLGDGVSACKRITGGVGP